MYPDGKTMFGTGWEITDVGTFSIIMKTGVMPGYSAGFAFVPEFKLGSCLSFEIVYPLEIKSCILFLV